ncbi:hypothetical protein CBL_10498, partial [Carabus blaptoides fortunei]
MGYAGGAIRNGCNKKKTNHHPPYGSTILRRVDELAYDNWRKVTGDSQDIYICTLGHSQSTIHWSLMYRSTCMECCTWSTVKMLNGSGLDVLTIIVVSTNHVSK